MDPISRKKTSVSPYNKKDIPESPPPEIPAPNPISKPITGNTVLAPEPISEPITENTVLAPEQQELVTDIETVDRRVEALIDYLEQWIRVGNLKMTDIRDYIENNS